MKFGTFSASGSIVTLGIKGMVWWLKGHNSMILGVTFGESGQWGVSCH